MYTADQGAVVKAFYDQATYTISYVVHDPASKHAAVIDSVLDYDPNSGRTSTKHADAIVAYIQQAGLQLVWILETHAHADHLSAAAYLKQRLGGQIAIGESIRDVQQVFKRIFDLEPTFVCDGSQFDRLLQDQDTLPLGQLLIRALHLPGHTPADMAYCIADAVFVGDTLFMPDVGTARCDFPGGDARTLYQSLQRLFKLPKETRLFMCHDYPEYANRTTPKWQTTIGEQLAHNIHVHHDVNEATFVAMREARDASLAMPVLILPSIQINIRAGEFPPANEQGQRFLKIPLNAL
ncbi:MBL fold metallo-hydrolase [Parvibium lacunae]|uniref:MBL fold metallo-hydrolase n=1 Tax=Parvibium lacunae TaxID=1888893 RepID=A0A368L3L1_9BURK|nr:MBL fold metallo-hydrolase [Parvibium lacunae]RCS58159.1 MBL fold metallo-hydrolase [Parvibium lacunae]